MLTNFAGPAVVSWSPPAGCVPGEQGPLSGLSAVLKDCFDLEGAPTLAGSRILETLRPAPHPDSALVRAARASGLRIIAKTQMNEFAYGLDGRNAHYGDCPHPFLTETLAGGSSSGSAVMIALSQADVGFGTDTGGSIRVPASFCGLWGIRLVPELLTEGCFPLAPTFDTVGWMTRDLATMARVSQALVTDVPREGDSGRPLRCLGLEHPMVDAFSRSMAFAGGMERWARPQWDRHFAIEECVRAFNILQSSEAYELHRDWLEMHAASYDPGTRERIERARYWGSIERCAAQVAAQRHHATLRALFEEFDVLVLPVAEGPPPPASAMGDDFRTALLRNTVIASLGQLAVLSMPVPDPRFRWCGIQMVLPPGRWPGVLGSLLRQLAGPG